MSKENQNEVPDNITKEPKTEREKYSPTFTPLHDKVNNDSQTNQNFSHLQNSACKNLKNDAKSESANIYM